MAQTKSVAAGDVRYHVPARMVLHDIITAIRHGTTIESAPEYCWKMLNITCVSLPNCAGSITSFPALARTVEVADRCSFSLSELRYEYPEELVLRGLTHSSSSWLGPAHGAVIPIASLKKCESRSSMN